MHRSTQRSHSASTALPPSGAPLAILLHHHQPAIHHVTREALTAHREDAVALHTGEMFSAQHQLL
jgi:hypothetical protein